MASSGGERPVLGWLMQRRFFLLLLGLTLMIVVYPFARRLPGEQLFFHLFLTFLFLSALLIIFQRHATRLPALFLSVPTLLVHWTGYVLPGAPPLLTVLTLHFFTVVFLGFTLAVLLVSVAAERRVTPDTICAGLCGYLLIGMLFGQVYGTLETLSPGSFAGNPAFADHRSAELDRQYLLSYFSFATLTTLGYGDIVPASDGARGLVIVEGVLGQFYLAVLIAELVGKRMSQAPAGPAQGSGWNEGASLAASEDDRSDHSAANRSQTTDRQSDKGNM
jgi:hypothetical protein